MATAALTQRPLIADAWLRCCRDEAVRCLGAADSAEAILEAAGRGQATRPIVLVDAAHSSVPALRLLRAGGCVLFLLAPAGMSAPVRHTLRVGLDGLATVADPVATLRDGLRELLSGRAYVSPVAARLLLDEQRAERMTALREDVALSQRERAVLQGLVDGLSTKAIARRLGVAVKTVEAHRTRLFTHLRVRTRSEAVLRALTEGDLLRKVEGDRS